MIKNTTKFRVRYAETDQMGYVYYGNYAAFFEVGRVELLREMGLSYREMEEEGIILPVRDFTTRYYKPATYDEEIFLETRVEEMPSVRITFHYDLRNAKDELLTSSKITLVFADKSTGRPRPMPKVLADKMSQHFAQ